MQVQSGFYSKEVKSDTKFCFCYDYLRAMFNCGFGMSKLDICCRCILFNVENNVEKQLPGTLSVGRQSSDDRRC